MGKKLVINGADFSANAVETDYSWITVLEGSYTSVVPEATAYINLDENLPEGTITRLTQQVTAGNSKVAIGAKDTNNTLHPTFWHANIDSTSGVVTDVKNLTFDMTQLVVWIEAAGTTVTYKLEVSSI